MHWHEISSFFVLIYNIIDLTYCICESFFLEQRSEACRKNQTVMNDELPRVECFSFIGNAGRCTRTSDNPFSAATRAIFNKMESKRHSPSNVCRRVLKWMILTIIYWTVWNQGDAQSGPSRSRRSLNTDSYRLRYIYGKFKYRYY